MRTTQKRIGRGLFSTAYLSERKTCILKSIDPVKAAIAEDILIPNHRLFPKIKKIDSFFKDGHNGGIYEMEYLPRPKSIKNNVTPRQWRLYSWLRGVFESIQEISYTMIGEWKIMKHQEELIRNCPREFKNESEAILEMINALKSYFTFVGFEISPRNVSVKGGKLILLDCFFSVELLQELRKKEAEKIRLKNLTRQERSFY